MNFKGKQILKKFRWRETL